MNVDKRVLICFEGANAIVDKVDKDYLRMTLIEPERVIEFRELLRRALNTWDKAPKWIIEISDAMEGVDGSKHSTAKI